MLKMLCLLAALLLFCPLAKAEGRVPAIIVQSDGARRSDAAPLDPRIQPAVALSFDDGPSGDYTQPVLDILAENDCRATFFMVGAAMDQSRELVKAVYDSGNEVGLHTWRHNDLNQMDANAIVRNLELCQNIVLEQTGTTAKWLRPPYGRVGPTAYSACNALGMYIATWTIDSRDWETQNAETIYNEVIGQLRNGAIILFHDTHAATVEALKSILPEIKAQGYQVLTVDQLMSFRESLRSATHYYHLDMEKLKPLQ